MLSIPKYPEQYAQHFPTIFYLLCCASQHHVYTGLLSRHTTSTTHATTHITTHQGGGGGGCKKFSLDFSSTATLVPPPPHRQKLYPWGTFSTLAPHSQPRSPTARALPPTQKFSEVVWRLPGLPPVGVANHMPPLLGRTPGVPSSRPPRPPIVHPWPAHPPGNPGPQSHHSPPARYAPPTCTEFKCTSMEAARATSTKQGQSHAPDPGADSWSAGFPTPEPTAIPPAPFPLFPLSTMFSTVCPLAWRQACPLPSYRFPCCLPFSLPLCHPSPPPCFGSP